MFLCLSVSVSLCVCVSLCLSVSVSLPSPLSLCLSVSLSLSLSPHLSLTLPSPFPQSLLSGTRDKKVNGKDTFKARERPGRGEGATEPYKDTRRSGVCVGAGGGGGGGEEMLQPFNHYSKMLQFPFHISTLPQPKKTTRSIRTFRLAPLLQNPSVLAFVKDFILPESWERE